MTKNDPRLDALPVIRRRWCEEDRFQNGGNIKQLSQTAVAALLQSMRPDGSWADVDYGCQHLLTWSAATHLDRLLSLAHASYARADAAALAALLRGLDYWYARSPQNPNWWWMEIGAPTLLGEVLLRVRDACDRSYVNRAVPAFVAHEPTHRFTGQNLVWVAGIKVMHGLLTDDAELVSYGMKLIGREMHLFPSEEGLQPDMSFFQHGRLLYSGGYGQNFAADVARFIAIGDGTAYVWPRHLIDLFARFVLDGSRWMVRGRTFNYGACGREITRQGHSAERFFLAASRMAGVEHPRRAEFQAAIDTTAAAGRSLVTGNRHFWCGNLMAHHRADCCFSIRLTSNRLENVDAACCGGEGRLAHHMADGLVLAMRTGDEYRDIFPVWDWRKLPGTTAEQRQTPLEAEPLTRRGERAFAGGVSDGQIGCAAMDFSSEALSARKAWFCFDGCLAALGAGIVSTGGVRVQTAINQCRRSGPVYVKGAAAPAADGDHPLAAGSCFWHDSLAYGVLAGEGSLSLAQRSGAWSDCGVGSSDPVSAAVFQACLDHGISPSGAAYAYTVTPSGDHQTAFNAQTPVSIIRNDTQVQAVWHAADRLGQAVFYEPAAASFPDGLEIWADRPCILIYRPGDDGKVSLTLADPSQKEPSVSLRLRGPLAMAVEFSLPQAEYAGASVTLTLAT